MRFSLLSLTILFFLNFLALEAQTDISVQKKDFKTGKSGFNIAWRHVSDGDIYYSEGGVWYNNAFDEYLKAIVYNSSNAELNYKTGISALFSDNKEEAAGFLLKALELKKDITEDILLLTGRALQYSGRFSEAKAKFNEYLVSHVKKSEEEVKMAKKYFGECNSAFLVTKDTLRIAINNLGTNINSSADDYSEIISNDGKVLYFASRQELPVSVKRYADTKFDENIFYSLLDSGRCSKARLIGNNLLTKYCETPLYINSRNDQLYIYAGYENGGDIEVSEQDENGEWKAPESIPFSINTKESETSFTFAPSGNEIYFVSDNGTENIGGKDIYFIKKLGNHKWSKPRNAGSKINSVYDEESVRFSRGGDTLWFSSRGHNSIGGFDIFYSIKNKLGEWDSVKNAGYPLNTQWDELFYFPSPVSDSSFYFASDRGGGLGGFDIYQGRILPPRPLPVLLPPPPKPDTVIIRDTVVVIKEVAPPPPAPVIQPEPKKEMLLFLIGQIMDSETGEPVIAKIDIIDVGTNLVVGTGSSSDIDGSYRVRLPEKKSYMVDLRATGFLSDMRRIDVPDNWPKDVYNLNIDLIKLKIGKKVVLNNILFETGKAILTPGSSAELERLFNILQDNPKMKIEISGHTDKTGSEPVNFKLSGNRAKSVVDYLVNKGIDRARMEFKGFGSLQPVADNGTPQGRAKNRRVEFKILEF